ncbi:MAG: SulP family inorganic anion transporter [Sphaerochaetaceae bacterium]|jgi:SulP family sulfate permease|nr:SulP family inorganic anion transporter [Sphaerochaetaceae bacterium]NLO61105.1 SulP family inorganic anion transporter [Spirochaetales bacterium]MDD2406420.1 SulP family inorganic anion transporter [Sphaerochaetaceae bacterium]MDD4259560.1 SulP family inorganic anion transporter [Sphaerochaetaceae bacterium]MDD4762753.1 SulP family inorganic anion transporter [Sphaerochaetaceae bacterium]
MIKHFSSDLKREFSGYNGKKFSQDLLAGLTVTAVALPLALAFGVSSGADAAAGLITAIIAGIVIGALSGASYQISGPTGAMTAILLTLSARFGIEGVFIAGMLSGVILIIASLLKAGKVVTIIPSAVITGFTSGIAIIIALGQLDNLFGTTSKGESLIQKLLSYGELGFHPSWQPIFFGLLAIVIMVIWPKKWGARFPSSLLAIIIALGINLLFDFNVTEVGKIPRTLLPERRLTFGAIQISALKEYVLPALSIAALGMVESLLCGASAGKMKNEKLNADRELLAQGIGNIIIPFLGGVPATAAIARTSVAIKSGSVTRLTSIIHAIGLVASMFLLGPAMSRIPLAALSGVLVVTAWRMNEWDAIKHIFSRRYKTSIAQFAITMVATVVFDLTIAIVIGIVFSMVMFVLGNIYLNITVENVDKNHRKGKNLTDNITGVKLVYISGQLFFGSIDQFTSSIRSLEDSKILILSIRGVPMIDQSAMGELDELWKECENKGIKVLFCGLQPMVTRMFNRSGFIDKIGENSIFDNAVEAIDSIQ